MKILQVKKYHNTIAKEREAKVLKRWREKDNGYGYPIKTMFYFYLSDRGYPTTKRKKGYIAFDIRKKIFGATRDKAIENFKNC
ncbi:MAG: hypothetical protein U9R01_02270 [candidate division WOR-3 bacterium]|nr:hypothetical protein [candidate division WOR-3 bacterium]